MPYSNAAETGDFEKLQKAFSDILSTFGSVDNLLDAFGLSTLPSAQRYGIVFGCFVFVGTVTAVLTLLVLGGSFHRMAEQTKTGAVTIAHDFKARLDRPLLLERLLDARTRMMQRNYPNSRQRKEGLTNLTSMLLNVAPPPKGKSAKDDETGYMRNFVVAYRKCQDKPGGDMISGRPEARFEAFARSYAGCGDYVTLSYRRSYARMYESISCENHKTDDEYGALYKSNPEFVVGKYLWLEGLDAKRHLEKVYAATSGDMYYHKRSYNPSEVWGFLEDGPFDSPEALRKSFVFQQYENQAAFCIVQSVTKRILGVIMLSHDDPENLSIQLEPPIMSPANAEGKEELEACFLLMDRLFANGYRRIQLSVDAQDGRGGKVADRLGFTFEGCILKDRIVKEASRDSNVYGMLNSDWDKGARKALMRKLYGASTANADEAYNKKEEELDEQQRVLAERKMENEQNKKNA